jgi:hypothetical protein
MWEAFQSKMKVIKIAMDKFSSFVIQMRSLAHVLVLSHVVLEKRLLNFTGDISKPRLLLNQCNVPGKWG